MSSRHSSARQNKYRYRGQSVNDELTVLLKERLSSIFLEQDPYRAKKKNVQKDEKIQKQKNREFKLDSQ